MISGRRVSVGRVILALIWLQQVANAAENNDEHTNAAAAFDASPRLTLDVPNPFKANLNGYYLLEGTQLSQSSHKADERFHVRSYFSLSLGISHTIYTKADSGGGGGGESYAILSDTSFDTGKTYLLRTVDETNPAKIDCELDYVHNHKHVFPFQYNYDLNGSSERLAVDDDERAQNKRTNKSKGRRKGNRKRSNEPAAATEETSGKRSRIRASIYGPGAVWLNLIARNVRSSEVQNESLFSDANVWQLHENDLSVEFGFAKPVDEDLNYKQSSDFGTDMQQLIDASQPRWLKVSRSKVPDTYGSGESAAALSGTVAAVEQNHYFTIDTFQTDLTTKAAEKRHAKTLQRLILQLNACRTFNAKRHVFPCALNYLTLSPQRLIQISYIKRTFPLLDTAAQLRPSSDSVRADEKHHSHNNEFEFVTELLSLNKEAQLCQYEKLPVGADADAHGLRADVYIKLFTGALLGNIEQSAKRSKQPSRSTRHSTSFYHLIEIDSKLDSCNVGEREPTPKWPIFSRALHFNRYANEQTISMSGHLTGLLALLLNAADIHYKEFNLFKKRIEVSTDVYNLESRTAFETDEWILHERKSAWDLHFYFKQLDDASMSDELASAAPLASSLGSGARSSIEQLVRVDIRDAKVGSNNAAQESEEDKDDTSNLLMRFEIVSVEGRLPEEALEFYFTPPALCLSSDEIGGDDKDDKDDDDDDEDFSQDTDDEDEFYDNNDNFDNDSDEPQDSDEEDEDEQRRRQAHNQAQGEDFEFAFDKVLERTGEFPNFFEFLNEQPVYEIESKITLKQADDNDQSNPKSIYLTERVDLQRETSTISVYLSETAMRQRQAAHLTYWFNYESEMLFVVRNTVGGDPKSPTQCSLADDIDEPWLRLLSKEIEYFTEPAEIGLNSRAEARNSLIESNRLRLYGVGALWRYASESAEVELLGRSRTKINKDGLDYYPVVYALNEMDMGVHFVFMWNLTRAQEEKARAQDEHKHTRSAAALLHLSSIYFSGDYLDTYETDFRSVEIEILSWKTKPISTLVALPSSCLRALSKANEVHRKLYEDLMLMPKFEDLFGESDTYYARYSIIQSTSSASTASFRFNHLTVTEMFDRRENRGWIKVEEMQKNDAQVFIDGKSKRILAFSEAANQCKQVSTVKTLVELGPEFAGENSDFDPRKMYGLAALWIKLSAKPMKLYSWFKHFADGSRNRVHTYSTLVAPVSSKLNQVSQTVRVSFVEKRSPAEFDRTISGEPIKTRLRPQLALDSIRIVPQTSASFGNKVAPTKQYTTTIDVESMDRSVEPSEWSLPSACHDLLVGEDQRPTDDLKIEEMDTNTEPAPRQDQDLPAGTNKRKYAEENFPRLTPLLYQLNKFQMRSEVIIRTSRDSSIASKVYLLDERYFNGNVRLKSYSGDKKELDFLIFPLTYEYFDLSEQYKCHNNRIPKVAGVSLDSANEFVSSSKLAQFWRDNQTLVESPSEVYYGPLALWLMAEKNLAYAEKVETFSIAREIENSSAKKLDEPPISQDLAREIWQVKSPPNSLNEWTIMLEIEKVSLRVEGKVTQTWHVLRQASVNEGNTKSDHDRMVEIEIVNYRYNYTLGDIVEHFLLPDGHGCTRSDSVIKANLQDDDMFDLDKEKDFHLVFEATLEVLKEENDPDLGCLDVRRQILPALSGMMMHSGLGGAGKHNNFLFSGQHTRSRHLHDNALPSSKKIVTNREKSTRYEIDEFDGSCSIVYDDSDFKEFVLEFKTEDDTETYKIDVSVGEMIKFWFVESENKLTNKYVIDRTVYTTYEQFQSTLNLNAKLNGPAAIIRTYTQDLDHPLPGSATIDGKVTKLHDEMRTKVMLFDEKYEKLRAVLNLRLHKLPNPGLSNLLQQLSVTDCFNNGNRNNERRMGLYLLEYPLEKGLTQIAQYLYEPLRDIFYSKLLDEFNLDPTQLDGHAEISIEHRENKLRIYFKVWEASFYQHFSQRRDATISDELLPMVEAKPSPNFDDCSSFCQHLNCIAMSYCWLDHSCQIVPESSFHDPREELNYDQTLQLSESKFKKDCNYLYHTLHKKTLSLREFSDTLDRYVNSVRSQRQLGSLTILVPTYESEPSKFVDLTEDVDFSEDVVDKLQSMFKISDLNHKVDLSRLDQLRDSQGNKFESHVVESKLMYDCMDECIKIDCIYLAHCRKRSVCTLVTGSRDIHLLETDAKVSAGSDEGCTVAMRDYLSAYVGYANTLAPVSNKKRLDNYNEVECAAVCESADEKCLSFDVCQFKSIRNDQKESAALKSVCFLQESHLSMDNFEMSILGASLRLAVNEIDNRKVSCKHYAKSIISNFKRIPNRKFYRKTPSIARVRGESVDRCAGICYQKEDCEAFEYCVNEARTPVQACRFMQLNSDDGTAETGMALVGQVIGAKTVVRKDCSVYYRTKLSVEESLSHNLHSESWLDKVFESHGASAASYLSSLMLYLFIAVLVGLLIQVVHLKTTGRSVLFR